MNRCLSCASRIRDLIICSNCSKDASKIEQTRQLLARENKLSLLKKMYCSSYASFSGENTPIFWDPKLRKEQFLANQGRIDKERIKTSVRFMPKRVAKVLDIGAGYGFLEEILEKKTNINVSGIDISPEGIKNLKKRFEGEFKLGSILKIPFNDNSFDVVFTLEILEHLSADVVFKAFSEIKRVLKKTGCLIISVPVFEDFDENEINSSNHKRKYTPALIKAEARIAGFTILNSKEIYAFHRFYFLKFFLRYLMPKRWQPNNIVIKCI